MGRRKVLLVITELALGGAQKHVLDLARHLDRQRFQILLACGQKGELHPEARELTAQGRMELHVLPSLTRPIRPIADLRALRELRRLCRRERVDILHTHSSKAGILGRWAAFLGGVPVRLHTIHGWGFHAPDGRGVRWPLLLAERATALISNRLISVSRRGMLAGVAHRIAPPWKMVHVPHAIPLDEPRTAPAGGDRVRGELGISGHAPLVGMIACLKPQKAPLDFVEVAARVLDARPETRFILAGDGELREALEANIRAQDLQGRLQLLGWRKDIPALLDALDILVLTSRWEGLPGVVLEGMAAGLPVVASNVGGIPELVRDGVSGYLVRPGDLDGTADRILALLEDPELRTRMGKAGSGLLEDEHDVAAMAQQVQAIYEEEWRRSVRGRGDPSGPGALRTAPQDAPDWVEVARRSGSLVLSSERFVTALPEDLVQRAAPGTGTIVPAEYLADLGRRALLSMRGSIPRVTLVVDDLRDVRSRGRELLWATAARWIAARRLRVVDLRGQAMDVSSPELFRNLVSLAVMGGMVLIRSRWRIRRWMRSVSRRELRSTVELVGPPERIMYLVTDRWRGAHRTGGSRAHIVGIVTGFAQLGIAVDLLSTVPLEVTHPAVRLLRLEGQPAGGRPLLPAHEELAAHSLVFKQATALLAGDPPDLIVHRLARNSHAAVDLAHRLGCPLILEVNGPLDWESRNWGKGPIGALAREIEWAVLHSADRIVAVSRPLVDHLLLAGIPRDRIVVQANAADPDRFPPDLDGQQVRGRYGLGGVAVVGFLGTFGPGQGTEVLARAVARVLQERRDVRFLFMGDGSLRSEAERIVRESTEGEPALFTGLLPADTVPEHLAACDILVSPQVQNPDGSEFFGSPIKLFEYMMAGRAIVASRIGQVAELLDHGRTAVLVPPGDEDELTGALIRLVAEEDLRIRLGCEARKQALRRHTWTQAARSILDRIGP